MEEPNESNAVEGTSVCEEGSRSCRNKRKQKEPSCCPVCSVTLRSAEIDLHVVSEIDKLVKLSVTKHKVNGKNIPSQSAVNGAKSGNKYWETYQKVRSNRQGRQRVKSRKRRLEEIVCPVCNKETNEDINLHVEMCLRRSENNGGDSDENIDVEGGFEEYEWAGQSRVRATSLLQGGMSSLGTSLTGTDEDEDLVVDGDDAQMYGAAQYSERDIIIPGGDKEQEALRKAILGSESVNCVDDTTSKTETVSVSGDPILEALKNRIRELEHREQTWDDMYKCLICMERYKTPVISVCCWHVHCEQCWLQTLGAKKLCPQCNMITSPADLRRIYM
ncbi:hypothetical protein RN001_016163 [Aquatica leii]|uniref:RING-type domain-containing protein n=1 Tax=Aquatica leii TaxID=1421715 RepID=A0AAN7SB76_9COLE|nr:hypothetical protein RN001_016163 [Aquatica leii]